MSVEQIFIFTAGVPRLDKRFAVVESVAEVVRL